MIGVHLERQRRKGIDIAGIDSIHFGTIHVQCGTGRVAILRPRGTQENSLAR